MRLHSISQNTSYEWIDNITLYCMFKLLASQILLLISWTFRDIQTSKTSARKVKNMESEHKNTNVHIWTLIWKRRHPNNLHFRFLFIIFA